MVTTSTSLASPEPSTWKIALCSESTGRTEAPDRSSASRNTAPAATTHSLLASATITPRPMAASAGSIAAAPMIATMTKVRRHVRRRNHRVAPGFHFDAGARQTVLQLLEQRHITDHGAAGPKRARLLDQKLDIGLRGQRRQRKRIAAIDFAGMGDHIQRVDADRTGRSQDGDAAMDHILQRNIGGWVAAMGFMTRPRTGD